MPARSPASQPIPSLIDALSDAFLEGLSQTADSWIRAELPSDWPLQDGLVLTSTELDTKLAVGILPPIDPTTVSGTDLEVSSDASAMTRWRRRTKKSKPTIIVGDARGPEEAGLRAAHIVVTEEDVLSTWRGSLLEWLSTAVFSETPAPVSVALFQSAQRGDIDAGRLDDYFQVVFSDPDAALDAMRSNLWILNLIPDPHILDVGRAAVRIGLNLDTRRLLLGSADTVADRQRLERLSAAASGGGGRGEVAKSALAYRETQDPSHLSSCDLDSVRAILTPRNPPTPRVSRPLDFYDLLDRLADCDSDERQSTLDRLEESWNLASEEELELLVPLKLADESEEEARIPRSPIYEQVDG